MDQPMTSQEQPKKQLDMQALDALGGRLNLRFTQYETERRIYELKWMRNLRQFLGEYDPDIKMKLDPNRSQAYPRLTRVKCMTIVSRLMNLMFPTSEKNWSIEPSPVPNLPMEVMSPLLAQVQRNAMQMQQAGQPVDLNKMVEDAILAEAKLRAGEMEKEMDDQLGELGGGKGFDYVALCRKVVLSGVMYGAGVLSGPFTRTQQQRLWGSDPMTGMLVPTTKEVLRPQYEFVSIWDYYPDLSAKTWEQMDGQFQRYVMSRHQVRALANRPDFFGDVIKQYLQDNQQGNYKRRTYESELKALGTHVAVGDNQGRKYELIKWEGFIYASELSAIGVEVPDNLKADDIPATIWLLDGKVIKADMNPWFRLTGENGVKMYHQFVFEEDDTALIGNGVPNIMRDSQMSIAATARMALDNAGVTCGPQLELNLDLLRPDQDLKSIGAYKIWYREGVGIEAQTPAIKEIKLDAHIGELVTLMDKFREFADTETFVTPANGGDMSRGPSEPFRTATGASILKGDAALPFKDVVRNFDVFTQSVMASLVAFNQHLNTKQSIKGDYQIIAKGAMSLVAKEVRGIQLDQYLSTLQPEERPYVNWYEMSLERGKARDLPIDQVYVNEQQAEQINQQQAQKAQKEAEDQDALMRASVRKILAEAMKNLTQADKNSAAAATNVFQTLLESLQNGVTPQEVAAAGAAGRYVPSTDGPGGAVDGGMGQGAEGVPPAQTGLGDLVG